MALKFEYNKKTRTAEVCGVEDKFCEQIVIPSTVEYYGKKYDVVAIKGHAFQECIKLKSATIPNSVTAIGCCAFSGCSSLTSITIPDSVTVIGWAAFSHCSNLTSITIPDSVTEIGDWAFQFCSNLKEFKGKFAADNGRCLIKDGALIAYVSASDTTYAIPNGVTKIVRFAFQGCSSLTSITIPDSVTYIGERAFHGCSSLTSVTIPDSVTSIGDSAFLECFRLTSVTIPNSVTAIGKEAFHRCSSLTSVTIPNSVTKIGKYAFSGCSSLTSINIPDSVTYIGERAFLGCSSLTSITIPDSVTSIEEDAFYGCSSLTSITIPDSVTSIGYRAFYGCSSLKKVEICNEKGCVNISYNAFGFDVKVTYLGKAAQPKPKQEVKEQPTPEVATPAPTIDLDKLIDAAAADGRIYCIARNTADIRKYHDKHGWKLIIPAEVRAVKPDGKKIAAQYVCYREVKAGETVALPRVKDHYSLFVLAKEITLVEVE